MPQTTDARKPLTAASALAAALETALGLYLRQEPEALRRCGDMAGKVVALDVSGINLSLYFLPGSDGIQVLADYEGEADTRLRGSPLGFARMSLGSRDDALFAGAVEIQGDTETGQQLQDILRATDWDWEEQLSHLTGDIVAHQVGTLARGARHLFADSRDTLQRDTSEYLQEEARLLPCRSEMEHFLADVDTLRADLDRLSARVQRLLQSLASRQ
jgi:ubiquinone biosynthesis protein UbiJ